ncbi:MAG: 6-phosphogluconolactonase [Candidatus Erwinia impunctatus]|nr:6-phosphogluconolactonase [Culicoides impunctatus]
MKQVVYTASPESQQIHVWSLEKDGELKLLQVVDAPGQVQPMVVNPHQPYLYVGVRPSFRIVAYRIDEQGRLSEAGQAPILGSPSHISVDREGRFIFVSSYNDACVSVSPVDAAGLPGEPIQVITGLEGCHSANIDIDNQKLFVPALKQDRICLFTLHDDGTLHPCGQSEIQATAGAGPRHMAFHPDGHFAYSVNELDSTVDVWQLQGPTGRVEKVQTLNTMPDDFTGTCWAADIHITPDGRHLYTCDRTSSLITVCQVNDSGSELQRVDFQETEQQPRGFNIDRQGQYLIAAGQKSHHLVVYHVNNSNGRLQPQARYAVGQGPMWVVTHTL